MRAAGEVASQARPGPSRVSRMAAGRLKAQLPTCYHEGYLQKRSITEKTSHKLWTALCGNALFFFHSSKDNYVEKLELDEGISLSDDPTYDRNLEAAKFQLFLKDGNVQLTAPSLEARELWKGYIYCVSKLALPSSFNLLPGQLHLLKEVVEQEKKRRTVGGHRERLASPTRATAAPVSPIYTDILAEMPACYYQISRAEAEVLLDRNQDKGNLLLRQGRDGFSLAVSTRQDFNGSPVFRHYRVSRQHEGGFAIAVEDPIPCETLHDVISCLVQKTCGALKPLVLEQAYEESITFIKDNAESGEKSLEHAHRGPETHSPVVAPKPAPRTTVSPSQPGPYRDPHDNIYLNPSDEEKVAIPLVPPRTTEGKKVPLLPPTQQKPPVNSHSSPETLGPRLKLRTLQSASELLPQDLAKELKVEVQKRYMSDQLTS
ncbi:signal-transducing adaptor protein 2b isoform X1 [Electrophorus electricus]|uniref:signal-transducing adaptor protein 2b isoform X1 n=1 Tax=Electrophorus electricus TaxID=8005 RepID=UPI0015D08BA4|nr:signal-transducing adaptor protein 2b isoform X1 [Electrophorus electricus]XP_035378039.1 signal-transducing adaptor protein 2b isoform X1 [Electrophorus electricus]